MLRFGGAVLFIDALGFGGFGFAFGGGGAGAFAFDRNRMLVGDPTAGGVYFNLNLATHPEGILACFLPITMAFYLPQPARQTLEVGLIA